MADLDPEKIGRSGIDPGTGSPLSQDVRNALLKKSTIDRSVFRNELLESENRKREIDSQNVRVIQSQEQALLGFNSNIQALRTDIGKLGTGLASIALLLQQDNAEELSRSRAEQEKERRLAEQQVRIGKENELEQKIQNALVAPVQKLTPKMNDVFGKIGAALGILFGGWLTNQVVQAIQASEEGNTKRFNDIKFNIVKNLAIVGGGLLAIRTGFSIVKNTIGRIASGLTRLLIVKPLVAASALLAGRGIGSGVKKPPGRPGGGFLGLVGNVINGVSGVMNFLNGENVDTALAALTFVPGGGVFRLARVAAGTVFTIDQIAEALGKNFTGADPKLLAQKKKELEEAKKREKENQKPSTSTKPAPTPPVAQPQTTMMGQSKTDGVEANSNSGASIQSSSQSSGTSSTSPPAAVESSPQSSIALTSFSMGSFGIDKTGLTGPESPLVTAPAQVTPPTKPPTQVGQLPEPQPSITMIKSSNNANQQANVPLTSGALSDVPLINSANPDNFYVLYSQLNYNVVM